LALLDQGFNPIVLDDLSTGSSKFLPAGVKLVIGDVGDQKLLTDIILENGIETILHFAGKLIVADSVRDPLTYYFDNTVKTHSLLQAAIDNGVQNFVFSSTAAVYGRSEVGLVDEEEPLLPMSPYGRSKLMSEEIIRDVSAAYRINYAILRYFNVAGADPQLRYGQTLRDPTNLIGVALAACAKQDKHIEIFGDDYPTHDGTCIRDFIHVADLADAHLVALRHLHENGGSVLLNCGYGRGYSVKEVLETVESVTGTTLKKKIAKRRVGDPVALISESKKLRALDWRPRFDHLRTIIEHAYRWEQQMSSAK